MPVPEGGVLGPGSTSDREEASGVDPGRGALPLTFLSPLEALVGGRGHVPATGQVLGLNWPHPELPSPPGILFSRLPTLCFPPHNLHLCAAPHASRCPDEDTRSRFWTFTNLLAWGALPPCLPGGSPLLAAPSISAGLL